MTSKTWWWIGGIAFFLIVVLIAGGVYVVNGVRGFARGIEDASNHYADINKKFPFTPPKSGELQPERVTAYFAVRKALQSATTPIQQSNGPLEALASLSSLPAAVSHAHGDALEQQSMSLNEYQWITRQFYTTIAAESSLDDPDPKLIELQHKVQRQSRGRGDNEGPFGLRPANNTFNAGLLDLKWLQVPKATRALVLEHADDFESTSRVMGADTFLLNVRFDRERGGGSPE